MVFGKWAKKSLPQRVVEAWLFVALPTLLAVVLFDASVTEARAFPTNVGHTTFAQTALNIAKAIYERNRASVEVALITTGVAAFTIGAAP